MAVGRRAGWEAFFWRNILLCAPRGVEVALRLRSDDSWEEAFCAHCEDILPPYFNRFYANAGCNGIWATKRNGFDEACKSISSNERSTFAAGEESVVGLRRALGSRFGLTEVEIIGR